MRFIGPNTQIVGALLLCPLWLGFDDCSAVSEHPSCKYDGMHKQLGDAFPGSDGCSTCSCTREGVTCTTAACAEQACSYGGKLYESGETFAASDGCNACACEAGVVPCTEKACTPAECELGGRTSAPGAAFGDDCNA
jgi:hypothetical protein